MTHRSEQFDQVPEAAARRLSNQIARAYRGTYGARTGLRTIVKSVTRQMLHGGSSPEAVVRAFEHFVLNHPACHVADARNVVTGELNSRMLVELTQECVADVALEATNAARAR